MPGCLLFTGGRFCLRFCLHKLSLPCGAAPHIKQLSEYLNVLKVLSSEHIPPAFGTIRLQDRKTVPLTAHWMLPTESLSLLRVIFFFLAQVRHQGSEEQKKNKPCSEKSNWRKAASITEEKTFLWWPIMEQSNGHQQREAPGGLDTV